MRAVQFDIPPQEDAASDQAASDQAASDQAASDQAALKQQVSARLAAHRARRASLVSAGPAQAGSSAPASEALPAASSTRANAIAAAVAERYARTQSYRSFLAEEAERATRQAEAAAEIAARNAAAVAQAQRNLMAELDAQRVQEEQHAELELHQATKPATAPVRELSTAGVTVRLYEDLGQSAAATLTTSRSHDDLDYLDEQEAEDAHLALDEEIAFRQSPVFDEPAGPTTPIPANLLEFPRQLVAARKARPVRALGPLSDVATPTSGQLRIFEVEPEQISAEPPVTAAEPVWNTIRLGAQPNIEPEETEAPEPEAKAANLQPMVFLPQCASIGRRAMATAVDGLLILGGFIGATTAFVAISGRVPLGVPAAIAAAFALIGIAILYQLLFFNFSDQTPGMRYARIGLCTFTDENPKRPAMRMRAYATILAALPLGLGMLWALLDEDGLGWHDRISRIYQREY